MGAGGPCSKRVREVLAWSDASLGDSDSSVGPRGLVGVDAMPMDCHAFGKQVVAHVDGDGVVLIHFDGGAWANQKSNQVK